MFCFFKTSQFELSLALRRVSLRCVLNCDVLYIVLYCSVVYCSVLSLLTFFSLFLFLSSFFLLSPPPLPLSLLLTSLTSSLHLHLHLHLHLLLLLLHLQSNPFIPSTWLSPPLPPPLLFHHARGYQFERSATVPFLSPSPLFPLDSSLFLSPRSCLTEQGSKGAREKDREGQRQRLETTHHARHLLTWPPVSSCRVVSCRALSCPVLSYPTLTPSPQFIHPLPHRSLTDSSPHLQSARLVARSPILAGRYVSSHLFLTNPFWTTIPYTTFVFLFVFVFFSCFFLPPLTLCLHLSHTHQNYLSLRTFPITHILYIFLFYLCGLSR